jgi:hypothetical protein
MTKDISKMTATPMEKKAGTPDEKQFWIVEILKKLLQFNYLKYGGKRKF